MRDRGSLNRTTAADKVVVDAALDGVADAQRQLMAEPIILVNARDEPVGQASKLQAHRTADGLPLHRAFSVFLYDAADRLLLQRRAASKVTFPLYWTNTCCSHPLHTDAERNPAGSAVLGAQRAAVRKLQQELGITGAAPEEFTYLTRIHYRAECVHSRGWGEHEIDYLLLLRRPLQLDSASAEALPVAPNPDEVDAVRLVTPTELRALLDDPAERVTPWFRLIAERFLFEWWPRLDQVLAQQPPHYDPERIHLLGEDRACAHL